MEPGKIIIVSAPSGAGKTSICHALLQRFKNVRYSISATTRQPRGTEQNDIDYYFLSADDFQQRVQNGEFAEWAEVHGNYYGTLKSELTAKRADGSHVLLDIDVQGAMQILSHFRDESIAIFVTAPSMEELEQRLRNRHTDSEETVLRRLAQAKTELTYKDKYDYIIVNDILTRAVDEVISLLQTRIALEERVS